MKSDRLTQILLALIAVALWINLFVTYRGVAGLRDDVSSIASNVSTLQDDINTMSGDISTLSDGSCTNSKLCTPQPAAQPPNATAP